MPGGRGAGQGKGSTATLPNPSLKGGVASLRRAGVGWAGVGSAQEFVACVAAAGRVAGVDDEALDLLDGDREDTAGGGDDVLLHHRAPEIVDAIAQRELADLRPLR